MVSLVQNSRHMKFFQRGRKRMIILDKGLIQVIVTLQKQEQHTGQHDHGVRRGEEREQPCADPYHSF